MVPYRTLLRSIGFCLETLLSKQLFKVPNSTLRSYYGLYMGTFGFRYETLRGSIWNPQRVLKMFQRIA